MTKTLISLVFLLGLVSLPAFAQKAEVFAGYQFTHLDGNFNGNGWNAAGTVNVNSYFGVTADFSGAYKNGIRYHTYLFGPTLSAGKGPISPFVHALFGGARISVSGAPGSANGFATALGGGVDAGMRHGIALRVIQLDWLVDHFSGVTDRKNVRASSGIVLRF